MLKIQLKVNNDEFASYLDILCSYIFLLVEWSEQLNYGAECRRKVVSSRLGFAMRRPKNSLMPAVNGYPLLKAKAEK